MSSEPKKIGKGIYPGNHSFLLTILSGLSFVVLLVVLTFVSSGFEALENKLRYELPTAGVSDQTEVYDIGIVDGQSVYVPTYSHIYANGGKPYLLETTLSIRNLDPKLAISISSVKYFDTKGSLVKDFVDRNLRLGPLETAEFLVEKDDISGGSGANFLIEWGSEEPVYEPLIEAIMVGFSGSNSISITSAGRALKQRSE